MPEMGKQAVFYIFFFRAAASTQRGLQKDGWMTCPDLVRLRGSFPESGRGGKQKEKTSLP